uniref:HU family DNA-binding protein n=1 Tax=candidate division CPR3 bacterium TaxID=2268181 RepID=A0A7C5YUJ3_UNCC3
MVVLKKDLVSKVAETLGISKRQAGEAVDTVFNEIVASLKKGEAVLVTKFGKFYTKKMKARTAIVPRSDPPKKITVPARTAVRFKAGKSLREMVK